MKREGLKYNRPQSNPQREDTDRISIFALIAANLIIIAFTLIYKWDMFTVMWVYWTQSLIIGLFWVIRILTHRNLYWTGLSNGPASPVYMRTLFRFPAALFFIFHYGWFHLLYSFFLRMHFAGESRPVPVKMIAFSACLFFAEELVSFLRRPPQQKIAGATFKKFMIFPYARIIPMHFTIIAAFIIELLRETGVIRDFSERYRMSLLLLFLILKTMADVSMYVRQKRSFWEVPDEKQN